MRNFFYYDELDNTMGEHQKLKDLYDAPILVRAGAQRSGIGRVNHEWLSPKDGLWFTFDIVLSKSIPSFALFVGYCIHQCLLDQFHPLKGKLQIKWTNDIMFEGHKLGGILCRFQQRSSLYQIGVGINTNNEIDHELGKFGAVSLREILGFEISNSYLCQALAREVECLCCNIAGDLSYITYCNENLFGKGKIAILEMGGLKIKAEILGIDPTGALLIRKEMGEFIRVHTGSILTFID